MLLYIYCLPGKLYANLQYLFPNGRVPVTATARRKDSTVAHFLFSSAFYFLIFWLLLYFGFFHMPALLLDRGNQIEADAVFKNSNGIKIVSGNKVMYLGNSCDFLSEDYGAGHWSLESGVIEVDADKQIKILVRDPSAIPPSC
jgi:hypothetical protein